jgi:hypothetical protein
MTIPPQNRRAANWRMAYLGTCVLLSALVFGIFVCRPGINGYDRAMFADMIYGNAEKPYVYRILLPGTVRLLTAVIPSDARFRLSYALAENPAVSNLFTILGWEHGYAIEYFVALALMYVALAGFVWAVRYLLDGVYSVSPRVRDVFTLLTLAGLTQFFRYYSYLYDFPNICLFTLGLALMVRGRWRVFIPVYLLACLNKETTILLTMIFCIHFLGRARMERKTFVALLLAQLAIFGLVQLGLFLAFRDNLGGFLPRSFPHHNLDVLKAYPLSVVFGWCGLVLLICYGWSNKPLLLRHGLWIVAPLVVLSFFLGYVDELRDFYEAYPIVLLLILPSIGRLLNFEVRNVAPQAGRSSD